MTGYQAGSNILPWLRVCIGRDFIGPKPLDLIKLEWWLPPVKLTLTEAKK
jgi:hypothetical protein